MAVTLTGCEQKQAESPFKGLLMLKYATYRGDFYVCHFSMYVLKICEVYFSQKLISKAKKYEIFGKDRTLMFLKGAEQVAKNPNVSENDISLVNKGAKNT